MGKVHSHSVDWGGEGGVCNIWKNVRSGRNQVVCRKVCLGEFDDLQCSANPEIVTWPWKSALSIGLVDGIVNYVCHHLFFISEHKTFGVWTRYAAKWRPNMCFGCKYPLIFSRTTTSLGHHIFRRIHVGQRSQRIGTVVLCCTVFELHWIPSISLKMVKRTIASCFIQRDLCTLKPCPVPSCICHQLIL
jgi:hypothetical protein